MSCRDRSDTPDSDSGLSVTVVEPLELSIDALVQVHTTVSINVFDQKWADASETGSQKYAQAFFFPQNSVVRVAYPCTQLGPTSNAYKLPTGQSIGQAYWITVADQDVALVEEDFGTQTGSIYLWDPNWPGSSPVPEDMGPGTDYGIPDIAEKFNIANDTTDRGQHLVDSLAEATGGSGAFSMDMVPEKSVYIDIKWFTGSPAPNDWLGVECYWPRNLDISLSLSEFGWEPGMRISGAYMQHRSWLQETTSSDEEVIVSDVENVFVYESNL